MAVWVGVVCVLPSQKEMGIAVLINMIISRQ